MDKASDYEIVPQSEATQQSGDSRFESWQGRIFSFSLFFSFLFIHIYFIRSVSFLYEWLFFSSFVRKNK